MIPELAVKTLHIWKLTLPQPADIMKNFASSLSVDELERVNNFRFKTLKDQFIAARGGLRSLVAFYLEQKPEEISFSYTEYGKPYIEKTDLNFSLSHSGNHVVYGFTRGACIGIDIEEIKNNMDFLLVGKLVFSEDEYTQFSTTPEAERALAFYRCWTRKEAYIKAIGTGFHFPLAEVSVSFLSGEKPRLLKIEDSLNQEKNWELEEMIFDKNMILAIATQQTGHKTFVRDLEMQSG